MQEINGWAVIHGVKNVKVEIVMFECQRCGKCCYFGGRPCPNLVDGNVCKDYENRPQMCRDYPVYSGVGRYEMCLGYRKAYNGWRKYWTRSVIPLAQYYRDQI